MMIECRLLLRVVFLLTVTTGSGTLATTEIDEKIRKLEAQLSSVHEELADLKAEHGIPEDSGKDFGSQGQVLEEKPQELPPAWINRFTLFGDFRYRHEWMDDESQVDDRNRHRIRIRAGFKAKVNDDFDVTLRLASGNNDSPTSTNQDLDEAFSSKNIWLDLAFFDCHPDAADGLRILGGKIKNPFFRAGNSDLMFDYDVNPEGIAVTYQTTISDNLELFGVAGGFYVEERVIAADTGLWTLQGGATYTLPSVKRQYVTAGAGYFNYGNTRGRATLGSGWDGNKYSGGVYDSDFDIAQGFIEVGLPVRGLPFLVFGDYLKNTSAKSSEDTGYLFGATIGRCDKPGSWQCGYNYRDLEADAVIGALTEATFAGGGTNVKGHSLCLGVQLAKNMQFAVSCFMAERERSDTTTDHDVVLADLKLKF